MGLFARRNDASEPSQNSAAQFSEPKEVIQRMNRFSLDVPISSRNFSDAIGYEQGWGSGFTARAIEEYKRFMVLAAISNKEVAPSKIVDEVWHKHLQDSINYQDEMCIKVLGKVIDHKPGTGSAEKARFTAQYVDTLLLYKSTFGEEPPSDIWPLQGEARRLYDQKIQLTRDSSTRVSHRSSGTTDTTPYDPDDSFLVMSPANHGQSGTSDDTSWGHNFLRGLLDFISSDNDPSDSDYGSSCGGSSCEGD